MDRYELERRRAKRARERYKHRQQMVTVRRDEPSPKPRFQLPTNAPDFLRSSFTFLQNALWHLVYRTQIWRYLALGLVGITVAAAVLHFLSGRIFPNMWVVNIPIGGMSIEEAEAALASAWHNTVRVQIIADGDIIAEVRPAELGVQIEPRQTAERARGLGLSGVPMGYGVTPVVSFNATSAQNFLLNIAPQIESPAYEAGYEWRDGQIFGIRGRAGRRLDLLLSLERLSQDPSSIITSGRFELLTIPEQPSVIDPSPYLDDVYALASQTFVMSGYDPFKNETIPWSTTPAEMVRWLAAGENGLIIREEAFQTFVNAINQTLANAPRPRYLDEDETREKVQSAIAAGQTQIQLRIRYLPSSYQVVAGDRGFFIGRKTGLPFGLIQEVNPSVNWGQLSIGQTINLPSRDLLVPLDPIPNKRIIVHLDQKWLVAYENGQPIFHWRISTGRPDAPTYPGIFQVLSHNDVAYGSGFSLCGETGCSQWEMYWFMGLYEVTPGLMNGFHGAVKLPNGAFLDDGRIGRESTFGCVMSSNEQAKLLYEWAEQGTVVEIISADFPPESDIAIEAISYMATVGSF